MFRFVPRRGALAVACALALTAQPSQAIAPVLLLFIKQMVKQSASDMIKDALLSGLRDQGCKGMALANAIESLDVRKGATGLPAGMMGMPMGMQGIPPEMAARMGEMMPNVVNLPPGMAQGGDQMAMMQRAMVAMSQPLSPPQTLAAIDELAELGFLPKAMQTELKECMLLIPASTQVLGMGMGMLAPIIPQLRQARDEMRALSPAEQDEVAATLADELKTASPAERKSFVEQLGNGFFPQRISDGVKARLGAK